MIRIDKPIEDKIIICLRVSLFFPVIWEESISFIPTICSSSSFVSIKLFKIFLNL